ncbi:hypothetical protein LSAT2_030669 [Lamellibrachia satsuma]|nr:hypothetical protein LSAT2_030669 [Lamellibrachia satsuma]
MSGNLRRLFVGNIPWTVSQFELKQYFAKFGPVRSASIIFDDKTGISKGYGFVSFANRDAFSSTINHSDHELDGAKLNLQTVTPKQRNARLDDDQ